MKSKTKASEVINVQCFYQTTENAPPPGVIIKKSFYYFLKGELNKECGEILDTNAIHCDDNFFNSCNIVLNSLK